jgi:hypothetical protein
MPVYLIVEKTNQMCNRMFLAANIIATAIDNNSSVIFSAFSEYTHYFENLSKDLFCRFPLSQTPKQLTSDRNREKVSKIFLWLSSQIKKGFLSKGIFRRYFLCMESGWTSTVDDPSGAINLSLRSNIEILASKKVVLFSGPLFYNHPGLIKHKELIKEYFKPIEAIRINVEKIISDTKKDVDIVIGVHIRRGDYAYFSNGRFMYSDLDYIEKMNQALTLFPGKAVRFFITSNEILNASNFMDNDCKFGTGHPVEDLYSLAACDYIIGPPSTYSSWAAYYGKAKYHHFTQVNSKLTLSDFI